MQALIYFRSPSVSGASRFATCTCSPDQGDAQDQDSVVANWY